MPIYHCTSPGGLLSDSTRENIAKEITRIHCDATGAPRRSSTSCSMRPKKGVTSSPGSAPATQSCLAQSAKAAK
jgi:hypothetical protein